ncbi:hypothetical protein F5883DRAFT_423171 [Diaporthe sp. PMI_573]|nr:hypothetical protein F5883DRAFT_423171 [Diaporthaceae sp. PMI_573]
MTLTPNFQGDEATGIRLRLVLENPVIGADQPLVQLQTQFATVPTQAYNSSDIDASDAGGNLTLKHADNNDQRSYIPSRATQGDVVMQFTARHSGLRTLGPVADLRAEPSGIGLTGAGFSFVPVPTAADKTYLITVNWNLSGTPVGTRGIWTFGEGTGTRAGTTEILTESYYAVGQVQRFPPPGAAPPGNNYQFNWFGKPSFDATKIAEWTQQLFGNYQKFFSDDGDTYRVFARSSPEAGKGIGGTALLRSFMFFYGPSPSDESLKNTLAHEMTHNWPTMSGTDAETTWYVEGIADFYSARLPMRFDLITIDGFADEMNNFARKYYGNPFINYTNEKAAIDPFSTPVLQSLPYGRGNIFLVKWDAEIRAKSNGTRSIDNIVLALLNRTRSNQGDTLEDLLKLMDQELGPQARSEYNDMAAGKLVVPPEGSLGPCFSLEQTRVPVLSDSGSFTPPTAGKRTLAAPRASDSLGSNSTAIAWLWKKKDGVNDKDCKI